MPFIEDLLNLSLPLLLAGVFVFLVVASEIGYLLGRLIAGLLLKHRGYAPTIDENVSTITNSSLALLALFLGFTFSSALDHFEKNREAAIDEAIAIDTARDMSLLQPEPFGTDIASAIASYLDIRLQVADLPNETNAIRALQENSAAQQQALWALVQRELIEKPEAPMLDPLVSALNELVQAETRRTEYLLNGVPSGLFVPVAFFLLFNAILLGISLGEGAKRHVLMSWGLYFLVALAVGIIVDLDRPLKGFINVDQQAMQVLRNRIPGN